jgi:hypothetical protein
MQELYIGLSIAVFITILVLLVLDRRKNCQVSTLTMFGITMVVLGIIFSENREVCYSLIGVGVLLSVIEMKFIRSHS